MTRRPSVIVALASGVLVLAATAIALVAATEDPRAFECPDQTTENVIAEYGELAVTGKTPDQAVLNSTAVLDEAKVPEASRNIAPDGSTPDNGIALDQPATADVSGSDGAATSDPGGMYLVFVDGKVRAELYVEPTPDGAYWVSAYRFC